MENEQKLVEKVRKYLPESNVLRVEQAIEFAKKAHLGVKRASGADYYIHPLRAALSLAGMKLDTESIIATLLHDVLEDTIVSESEIKKVFGQEVLTLIRGVTKLSAVKIKKNWIPFSKVTTEEMPQFEHQVENLRNMLLAMSEDIRIIIIKLADKIDNMETLRYLPAEKQERIAREVLEIYAPIAHRLGMGEWKGYLEDLAFPFVYPKEFEKIKSMAIDEMKIRESFLKKVVQEVKVMLSESKIKVKKINFRAKRYYSLFKKLQRYDMDISKVYDLVAVRVIVDSVEDCYAALGLIHSFWKPLPGRIKDYIALPKPNGYQSLHTTVFSIKGKITEFQIRTEEMDAQAEFGIAAHWLYNEQKANRREIQKIQWLQDFAKMQKIIKNPSELADTFKMDLFSDRIFVFTPKGDVIDLPNGASALDFAYSVHTFIGNHCAGAKINGKFLPIKSELKNGDLVEISINKNSKPSRDWLKIVKTHIAKEQIRKHTSLTS